MSPITEKTAARRKELVARSGIFDAQDYLNLNPDVAIAAQTGATDALTHFVGYGWEENRQFSRLFQSQTYRDKHADIAAVVDAGVTTVLGHFFEFGIQERRQVNDLINLDSYLNANPDIAAAVSRGDTSPLRHYFEFGIEENRIFSSYFGAILHRETYQAVFKAQIGASFDVASASELTDAQVIDLVTDLGDRAIDVDYYRTRHAVSLSAFFGLPVAELSNEQVRDFAFNQGTVAGLARTPLDINAYRIAYTTELLTFYQAEAIADISEAEIQDFALGAGVSQGLAVASFLDLAYYRSEYQAVLAATFGTTATDTQVVDLVFGTAAPAIELDYYRAVYGQGVTAAGDLVADLDDDELRRYALTAGFAAGQALSPFDLETLRRDHGAAIATFYGAADATALTQAQLRGFLVQEAWAFGVAIADYTDTAAVELYREQNRTALAERYGIALDATSTLSAAVVLDFELGGASGVVDFDYVRTTFQGDAQAAFGSATAQQATDAQILDYVYAQGAALTATDLAAIDVRGYRSQYAAQIASTLNISIAAVQRLSFREVESFIFGAGAGLDLTPFVQVEYLRSAYGEAIAQSFQRSAASLSAQEVVSWYVNESRSLNVDLLRYQIESLSVGQQAQLFASVGLSFEATATLTTEQVIKVAYSSEFQALAQSEGLQTAAIDVNGYLEAHVSELYEFYFGAEVAISASRNTIKRTAGGFKASRTTKKTGRSRSSQGSKGTRKTSKTLKRIAGTLKTKKPKTAKPVQSTQKTQTAAGTAKNTQKDTGTTAKVTQNTQQTQKTGDGAMVTQSGEVEVNVETSISIEAKLELVQQLSREQVIDFMFGRGTKLGIDATAFVEVDFLRQTLSQELLATYEVSSTREISDRLVIDYAYGGLSSEIDLEFYRATYASELQAAYGLELSQITDTLVLEHAYEVGLAQGLALSAFDSDAIALAQANAESGTGADASSGTDADANSGTGSGTGSADATASGFDLGDFVDVDFLRETYGRDLLSEYRIDQVYNVSASQTLEFFEGRGRAAGGLNLAAAVDFDYYRSTYAEQITAATGQIDLDGNGAIDDLELFDYITGAGLEAGQNPSQLVDFAQYREAGSASATALLAHYGKTSLAEVSFQETLEFMFGAGLELGLAPSAAIDLGQIRTENAATLVAAYAVSSIEEVTLTQTFNYAFGAGYEAIGATLIA